MNNSNNIVFFIFVLVVLAFLITKQVKEHMQSMDPKLESLKLRLSDVHPMITNVELFEDSKSYTINKEKVFLCLKDKKGSYYQDNMLTYVFLHEIAHILCDEIGHTEKFYKIFNELLDNAQKKGLYNPSIPVVQDYCM